MEQQPQEPQPYRIYEDELLRSLKDPDLDHLMDGAKKAAEIAEAHDNQPPYSNVATAAELGLRSWVERNGYATLEPQEEPPES